MKWICCHLILFSMTFQFALAQKKNRDEHIVYNTTLWDSNGAKHKGFIVSITDSSIFISPETFAFTFENLDAKGFQEFYYPNIDQIILRPYLGIQKTIFKGAVGGLLLGVILGYYAESPNNPSLYHSTQSTIESMLIGGTIGAGAGLLIGAGVGVLKYKVFKIGRSKSNLVQMRDRMSQEL